MDTVLEWVPGYDIYYRVKHKNARPYRLLQALPIPTEQAERVNIDFITKLPAGEGGYDAVATIINPQTKRACVTLGLSRNWSRERIKGNQATFDNSQRNNLRSCVRFRGVVFVRTFVPISLRRGEKSPFYQGACK